MKISLILVILTFFFKQGFTQLYSFSANLNGKPSTQMIRSFTSKTTYIAVDDLLDILQIQYKINTETLQEEINFNEGTLVITAYNPFLFFKRKDGRTFSYQMLQATDYKYGKIFVPLKSFTEFLNKHLNIKIDVNEKAFLLNINYDRRSRSVFVDKTAEDTPPPQPPKTQTLEPKEEFITNQPTRVTRSTASFDLFDFTVEEKSNGYIFRIKSRKTIQSVSKNLSGKFLYLRIPNSTIDTERFNTSLNNGIIETISSIQNGTNADIKLTLKKNSKSRDC